MPTESDSDKQRGRRFVGVRVVVPLALLVAGVSLLLSPGCRFAMGRWYSQLTWRFARNRVSLEPARARLQTVLGPNLALPLPDARIVIQKAERSLYLYSGPRLIKKYQIGLGGSPTGRKERKHDGRTPEGQYHICTREAQSQYHLFLGLNYPNADDAGDALRQNLIARSLCDEITKAETARQRPSWKTDLGGAIGIHGRGSQTDWTLGCIAVDDPDIEEIYLATDYWTPVVIER